MTVVVPITELQAMFIHEDLHVTTLLLRWYEDEYARALRYKKRPALGAAQCLWGSDIVNMAKEQMEAARICYIKAQDAWLATARRWPDIPNMATPLNAGHSTQPWL